MADNEKLVRIEAFYMSAQDVQSLLDYAQSRGLVLFAGLDDKTPVDRLLADVLHVLRANHPEFFTGGVFVQPRGEDRTPPWLESLHPRQQEAYRAGHCPFLECWGGVCNKPLQPGLGFCDRHNGRKCWSCGRPATSSCDRSEMSLVCGVDQCHDHPHRHGQSAPVEPVEAPTPTAQELRARCRRESNAHKRAISQPWWRRAVRAFAAAFNNPSPEEA